MNFFKLWTAILGFFLTVCPLWAHGLGESPWFFVQISDPQIGFTTKNGNLSPDIEALDTVITFINKVKPDFVLVTGDLVNRGGNIEQTDAYLKTIASIDKNIPIYAVPGNHDIPKNHVEEGYKKYQENFGDTRFAFSHKGVKIIGIDTNPIKNCDVDREKEQYKWLEEELRSCKGLKNCIVAMHISPWLNSFEEDENYSNFSPTMRVKYHNLFKKYKVNAVYSGHLHNTAGGKKDGIDYFTCGSVSRPLGKGFRGVSVVTVYPDQLYHNYVSLNDLTNYNPLMPGYNSYKGLVMAGYQGWFSAEGDGDERGFHHYSKKGEFKPGACTIDMWPDVSEYKVTYPTEFVMPDGSYARVFSPTDPSTVDVHFRWMKEYGLDGVFMQRFVTDLKDKKNLRHINRVLDNAWQASNKYSRALCVMYDLSGMHSNDVKVLIQDIDSLETSRNIKRHVANPNYLYHNGKPLVTVWGAGFNDNRNYNLDDVNIIINALKNRGYSVMLGVPTYWREFGNDTEKNELLHQIIKECDIIMPWFVGRYNNITYDEFKRVIPADMKWCQDAGVDYVPLVFPGFSWKNMKGEDTVQIDRESGRFLKKQIESALNFGAQMIYVAMFDEIDEGTAIFKCAKVVPISAPGSTFVPIDADIDSDHYLKIVGEAARKLKK